jgi:hypothetical protein
MGFQRSRDKRGDVNALPAAWWTFIARAQQAANCKRCSYPAINLLNTLTILLIAFNQLHSTIPPSQKFNAMMLGLSCIVNKVH